LHDILEAAKRLLDKECRPDGYIGFSCFTRTRRLVLGYKIIPGNTILMQKEKTPINEVLFLNF